MPISGEVAPRGPRSIERTEGIGRGIARKGWGVRDFRTRQSDAKEDNMAGPKCSINRKIARTCSLKVRTLAMLHVSGAGLGREADCGGPDPIRRMRSGLLQ